MASSLGNRAYFPPLATGVRTFFFLSTMSRISSVTSVNRPHAVHLMIDTQVLVELHQRIRLLAIRPKSLENQILAIVGPMNQTLAADVANLVASSGILLYWL